MLKWNVPFCCLILVVSVSATNYESIEVLSLWRDLPGKMLLNISSVQPKCRDAYDKFMNRLNDNELDALKNPSGVAFRFHIKNLPLVIDATAKLPSGLLNGNIIQYGDFNQCMDVKTAQYCLAEIDLEPVWKEPYSQYKNLVHSYYFFREKFSDPAHRIPGFSMVRWGFCIPHECSSDDLEKSLRHNLGVDVQIRPGMCQKAAREPEVWTVGDYITRIFFFSIVFMAAAGTALDYLTTLLATGEPNGPLFDDVSLQVLLSFSLRRNYSNLVNTKENRSDIAGLHGIRALHVLALLMSHKAISLFFNPFMNRTATVDRLTQPWTILAKNAIVYTDTFMLLSGLLNANALLNNLKSGQPMNFKDKLINRIFRILPNFIAVILFCTYILPKTGSGPLWPTIIGHHAVLCKQYMWRNIFFVHNYFGFENMCLTHTHQLGIDMQLFLITPIVVYALWNMKKFGLAVMIILGIVSTFLRFWVVYQNELTSVVYFGISISKMFEAANLSYILPTHRATIYLIGVYLAYFLKFSKYARPEAYYSKIQTLGLWCFFLPIFLLTWVGPYRAAEKTYVYSPLESALINALYPISWGACISVAIWGMKVNILGLLGPVLRWKYFQVVTKLAYAIYLVQFPVFFYNVGQTKHVDEYQVHYQLQVFETLAIILYSAVLVLLIEMPFQNLKRVLFSPKKKLPGKERLERVKYRSG